MRRGQARRSSLSARGPVAVAPQDAWWPGGRARTAVTAASGRCAAWCGNVKRPELGPQLPHAVCFLAARSAPGEVLVDRRGSTRIERARELLDEVFAYAFAFHRRLSLMTGM